MILQEIYNHGCRNTCLLTQRWKIGWWYHFGDNDYIRDLETWVHGAYQKYSPLNSLKMWNNLWFWAKVGRNLDNSNLLNYPFLQLNDSYQILQNGGLGCIRRSNLFEEGDLLLLLSSKQLGEYGLVFAQYLLL